MDNKLYLKEKKIKITKGRVFILGVLEKLEAAVSADYIFEECRKMGDTIILLKVLPTITLFPVNYAIKA